MSDLALYNPDVLSCLANLSSDEVFTPPSLANRVLDMLPESLWSSPETRILDPVCKSGVFLREAAKRLDVGLEQVIPDKQERINHILTKQLFGIAITDLTALTARRSLYCSKYANGKYSVCTAFENENGNIKFDLTAHSWKDGKCEFCGSPQAQLDRGEDFETHAYQFIHTHDPQEIFNMKFDVIVGNPPYQLSDGGFGRSASPIYQLFVEQAMKLNPRYLSMIIPARWYSGGKGLDEFRASMLNDNRIREIHDYPDATDVFPGVQIKGGICYFLWNRDNPGDCEVSSYNASGLMSKLSRPLKVEGADTFVRYNEAVSILKKIDRFSEPTFKELVSSSKPFGFRTNFLGKKTKGNDSIMLYQNGGFGFVERSSVEVGTEVIDKFKVFIPPLGSGSDSFPHPILGKPFLGNPGTACTETYLYIGPFETELEARNVISYICTKFFRFLVLLNKPAQHATRRVYHFVPKQDFNKSWTDTELYGKYELDQSEIDFIESMIRPLEPADV
ncbi:MAG: Eco57I restriction-modification methylase domain-containing protein [Fimbriimonadaceae bacterium]